MIVTCHQCKSEFDVKPSRIKKGFGKFCSIECSQFFKEKERQQNLVICAYCSKLFYKRPSAKHNSKSGLFFCCREHKDLAQRTGGIREIQPSHYSNGESRDTKTYRRKAFRFLPHRCNGCGYCKIPDILDVHHKDGNRKNNKIENLELLCPTCHVEHHYLTRTGRYSVKSQIHQVRSQHAPYGEGRSLYRTMSYRAVTTP